MKFSAYHKKNFVVFSLVLMLGLIGYINYSLNKQSLLQTSSELEKYEMTMMEESGVMNELLEEEETNLNNGEREVLENTTEAEKEMENAVIVDSSNSNITDIAKETNAQITELITNKEAMSSSGYFIESKLERDKKRGEMITYLNEIINNQLTSEEQRNQATNMKLKVIQNTEKEVLIENMIMAKGFSDAIVYLSDQSINIVVNSDELKASDVAKIVDIVKRETDIVMDNIVIMNKK